MKPRLLSTVLSHRMARRREQRIDEIVDLDRVLAGFARRDHCHIAGRFQRCADMVALIALVGQQVARSQAMRVHHRLMPL